MADTSILKKLVSEAHNEVMCKSTVIMPPNVNEIKQRILYNLEAKAYDLIYELSPEDIDINEIVRALDILNLCYIYERHKYNAAQNKFNFTKVQSTR